MSSRGLGVRIGIGEHVRIPNPQSSSESVSLHPLSFGTPLAGAPGRPCTWCFPFSGAPERRRSPVGWPSSPGPPGAPPPQRAHSGRGSGGGCDWPVARVCPKYQARCRESRCTCVLENKKSSRLAVCRRPPVAGITVTHPTPTRAHGGHPLPPPPPPSPIHQGCWEAVLGTVGPKSPEDLV